MNIKNMTRILCMMFIMCAVCAAQNYTAVTAANIQDQSGNKLVAGQVCFTGVNASGQPIPFLVGGGGIAISNPACAAITNGAVSMQVPNPANTIPVNILYRIDIIPSSEPGKYTCTDASFSGATFDLDTFVCPNFAVGALGGAINGPFVVNGNFTVTGSCFGCGAVVATKRLYVDGTRTDTYTQIGSIAQPFKTIMGAVNQIIANGDNATYPYLIDVQPAVYVENVDIGNSAIHQILFEGHGYNGTSYASTSLLNPQPGAVVAPGSGNSFQALANDNQITQLQVAGFTFTAPVSVVNPTSSGTMGANGIAFVNDSFGGGLNLQSLYSVSILLSSLGVSTNFTATNCLVNWITSDMNSGAANVVFNSGLPIPINPALSAPITGTVLELQGWSFNPATLNVGSGTGAAVVTAFGAISLGSTGTITVNNQGTLELINATVFGNVVVNSGGTLYNANATFFNGAVTLNSGSTYTPAGQFATGSLLLGNGCQVVTGSGAPALAAPVCSLYLRTDGGASTTLYVKESGAGTSGWVPK